jgi:hypothetical protein
MDITWRVWQRVWYEFRIMSTSRHYRVLVSPWDHMIPVVRRLSNGLAGCS